MRLFLGFPFRWMKRVIHLASVHNRLSKAGVKVKSIQVGLDGGYTALCDAGREVDVERLAKSGIAVRRRSGNEANSLIDFNEVA